MRKRRAAQVVLVAAALALAGCATHMAAEPPAGVSLAGAWKLDPAASDDPQKLLDKMRAEAFKIISRQQSAQAQAPPAARPGTHGAHGTSQSQDTEEDSAPPPPSPDGHRPDPLQRSPMAHLIRTAVDRGDFLTVRQGAGEFVLDYGTSQRRFTPGAHSVVSAENGVGDQTSGWKGHGYVDTGARAAWAGSDRGVHPVSGRQGADREAAHRFGRALRGRPDTGVPADRRECPAATAEQRLILSRAKMSRMSPWRIAAGSVALVALLSAACGARAQRAGGRCSGGRRVRARRGRGRRPPRRAAHVDRTPGRSHPVDPRHHRAAAEEDGVAAGRGAGSAAPVAGGRARLACLRHRRQPDHCAARVHRVAAPAETARQPAAARDAAAAVVCPRRGARGALRSA